MPTMYIGDNVTIRHSNWGPQKMHPSQNVNHKTGNKQHSSRQKQGRVKVSTKFEKKNYQSYGDTILKKMREIIS